MDNNRNYKEFIRSSILKTCLSDELKAYDMIHNPSVVPAPSTPAALETGTLVHLLLLEPENFMKKVLCVEYGRRGDKVHKEATLAHPDKLIVKPETLLNAKEITARALRHKKSRQLLNDKDNLYEKVLVTTIDGKKHLAQADIYNTRTKTLIEVKTTSMRILYPYQYMRICTQLSYFCQLAHYKKVLENNDYPVENVVIFVQEVKYPFAYHLYKVTPSLLELGEVQRDDALIIYNKLLTQNVDAEEVSEEELVATGERFGGIDIGVF